MLSHPRLMTRKPSRRIARRRLRVEPLEERSTPATLVWTGDLPNNNNWGANVNGNTNWRLKFPNLDNQVLHSGDSVEFDAGASQLTSNNDLDGIAGLPFVLGSISFAANGYTLTGKPVYLNSTAGIKVDLGNGVSGKETIDLDISFGADQTWNINAASGTGVAIDLNGDISGNAGIAAANVGSGSAYVGLFGNNGYAGTTTVGNGTRVVVSGNNGLGSAVGGTLVEPGGRLVFNGGNYTTPEPVTLRRDLDNNSFLQFYVNNTTFAGPITTDGTSSGTFSAPVVYCDSGLVVTLTGEIHFGLGMSFRGAGNVEVKGVISGNASLSKFDAGTLTFSGNAPNTYTGETYVDEGTLELKKTAGQNAVPAMLEIKPGAAVKLSADDQIDNNAAIELYAQGQSTGELRLAGFSDTIGFLGGGGLVDLWNGNPFSPSNGTLTVGTGGFISTFSGVIQGAATNGGLTKVGTGTLTLTGANTYGGKTTVNAGILRIQNKQALGAAGGPPNNGTVVNDGGTLQLDLDPQNSGAPQTISGETLTLNGYGVNNVGALSNLTGDNTWAGAPIVLNASSIINVDGGNLTVTGNVQDANTATLYKLGTGTLYLPTANTHSFATVVEKGVLNISNVGALGSSATSVFDGGTLQLSNGISVSNNPLTISGTGFNGLGALDSSSGTNTWASSVTLFGDASIGVDSGSTLTLSHSIDEVISDSGLTKVGSGVLTLSSTAPTTYTGPTTIAGGNLVASADNVLPIATPLIVNSGAALNVRPYFVQVGSLSGSGGVVLDPGSFLRTGNDNTSTSFAGLISGTGQFLKTGSGTLTLTGDNDLTGFTSVDAGTLLINGSQPSSPVLVAATLGGTGTTGPIGVSGGTVSPGVSTGILTANGNVALDGASTLSVQLNGTTVGTNYDQLRVNGSVDLGNSTLNATLGFTPVFGNSFTIVDNDDTDPILGKFAGLPEGALLSFGSTKLQISYIGGDGNDVVLTDVPPSLSIDDVTLGEGDSGAVNAVFTVSLSYISDLPITVDFTTSDGTANAPGDYETTSGMLSIPAGSPSATISVRVYGDRVDELDETFFVNLANPVNAMIADVQGQATIVDEDTAGITVIPTSGLTTTEAGGTATFTVVLDSTPTSNVTISLSSSNTTEGNVSPTSLTFTPTDALTPRTVTVTGVDDTFDDGDIAYVIFTGPAVSSDPNYGDRDPADVSVTNLDDDSVGIKVTPISGLFTTEAGGTATFSIVLTSTPLADVTINVGSSDTTEGVLSLGSLTFTPVNALLPQTVTITGVNDNVDDGDIAYSFVLAAANSADPKYNGLDADDVALTNSDDDTAGIQLSVSPSFVGVTTENGASEQFFVVLGSEPTADVTLLLSVSNPAVANITPSTLTITPSAYALPHLVTVVGKDDGLADGTQRFTIVTAPSISADPKYDAIDVADIPFVSGDILPGNRGKFKDADGDTYTVQLRGPGKIGFVQHDTGGIQRVHLSDTDPLRSRLSVTVKKAIGSNALVNLDSVTGTGLKNFTAKSSDLLGPGINLTGTLGSLTIHDILNGADITAGASFTLKSRIKAHVIDNGTTIDVDTPVSSLVAARIGDGSIIVPSIGSLRITGDKKHGIPGDFNADVTLTATTAIALRSVSVVGTVSGSLFEVRAGGVGSFRAGSFIDGELLVGFTPTDNSHLLAGGTFVPGLSIGSFNVTRSDSPGFVNSVVAAATINRARLANVLTDNSGAEFGLIGETIGSVRIGKPAFVFGPSATGVGDFHVVDL